MKIIQVSDLHLVPDGQILYGLDPRERLRACIAAINAEQKDADFCVFTGDLANAGRTEAYEMLRECLEPLQLPYYLGIGNHDKRQSFLDVFPDVQRDENGFIQYAIDFPGVRFLMLDTVEEGEHWGSYCAERAAWLDRELGQSDGKPVYLFMHHPPFEIGVPSQDNLRIRDAHLFTEIVAGNNRIRHIFHGHVHRPVCGSWCGIPVSALRGTCHQVQLDLVTVEPIPLCHEPPAYAMILLRHDQTIVHYHDFLDKSAISETQASDYRNDKSIAGPLPASI
ncbi:MAG: phosphodiesterase [Hyphomicrobiaceae bacterium]|nr:phosphodiesterase [Hyphomicrobiaceae bacterium]